ncbi:MAG: hypothetical protein A2158_04150 [Chloroflexi bacterium RBG_13_46_14]|nr:MAG: hypothetical protein A2158_04150 [Chloroflexi bacterium RBG_13_46_14]
MSDIIMAYVDYENIRWRFQDYVEYITLDDIINAFRALGSELGELRQTFFYGDWTRRPQDSRPIEERGCRAITVLSKRGGGDRSDQSMSFGIYDQVRDNPEVTGFLIGAGDADYKEIILRCRERGKRVYVLCFGKSASRELLTMTDGFYPLEVRLNLTEKDTQKLPSPEVTDLPVKQHLLIQKLDSLEKALPYVVRFYFIKLMVPMSHFGETITEAEQFLDQGLTQGYIEEYSIDNPRIPGKQIKCLKLKRETNIVQEALTPK